MALNAGLWFSKIKKWAYFYGAEVAQRQTGIRGERRRGWEAVTGNVNCTVSDNMTEEDISPSSVDTVLKLHDVVKIWARQAARVQTLNREDEPKERSAGSLKSANQQHSISSADVPLRSRVGLFGQNPSWGVCPFILERTALVGTDLASTGNGLYKQTKINLRGARTGSSHTRITRATSERPLGGERRQGRAADICFPSGSPAPNGSLFHA